MGRCSSRNSLTFTFGLVRHDENVIGSVCAAGAVIPMYANVRHGHFARAVTTETESSLELETEAEFANFPLEAETVVAVDYRVNYSIADTENEQNLLNQQRYVFIERGRRQPEPGAYDEKGGPTHYEGRHN